jgi:hypothetical protein
MSVVTQISGIAAPMGSRRRRLLGSLSVVVLAAVVATGLRTGLALFETYRLQTSEAAAQQAARLPMPTSPQVEQVWGIRITIVQLLADHGLVEMRYLVVDSTKAARLHADSTSLANIPWIKVDGTDLSIKSQSVMYHFQHGVGQGLDGRTYSIIYGNANNAIHPGSYVSIVMPDGLELQHVPIGA